MRKRFFYSFYSIHILCISLRPSNNKHISKLFNLWCISNFTWNLLQTFTNFVIESNLPNSCRKFTVICVLNNCAVCSSLTECFRDVEVKIETSLKNKNSFVVWFYWLNSWKNQHHQQTAQFYYKSSDFFSKLNFSAHRQQQKAKGKQLTWVTFNF